MNVHKTRPCSLISQKRLRQAVLLGMLSLLLVACEQPEDDDGATNGATGDGTEEADVDGWEPEQDVTFVVHTSAGGGADTFARAFEAFLQDARPDVTITVENREGGGGLRAYTDVLDESGNPHVLSVGMDVGLVTLPIVQDAPFHWSDYTPIGRGEEFAAVAMTQPGEFEDLDDLIERSQEEDIRLGLAGIAGPLALAATLVEQDYGAEFDRVVLDSGAEIATAVQAGDVELGMPAPLHVLDPLEAGDADALAIFAEERVETGALADVPTATEEGVDVVTPGFRGVTAPPDIPEEARDYWIEAFQEWVDSDQHASYIDDALAIPSTATGDDFVAYLEELEETVTPAAEAIE